MGHPAGQNRLAWRTPSWVLRAHAPRVVASRPAVCLPTHRFRTLQVQESVPRGSSVVITMPPAALNPPYMRRRQAVMQGTTPSLALPARGREKAASGDHDAPARSQSTVHAKAPSGDARNDPSLLQERPFDTSMFLEVLRRLIEPTLPEGGGKMRRVVIMMPPPALNPPYMRRRQAVMQGTTPSLALPARGREKAASGDHDAPARSQSTVHAKAPSGDAGNDPLPCPPRKARGRETAPTLDFDRAPPPARGERRARPPPAWSARRAFPGCSGRDRGPS